MRLINNSLVLAKYKSVYKHNFGIEINIHNVVILLSLLERNAFLYKNYIKAHLNFLEFATKIYTIVRIHINSVIFYTENRDKNLLYW